MTEPAATSVARPGLWPQALFLLAGAFASRLIWYDLRVVRRELLEPGHMRAFFAVYALCMAPFILLILGRSITRALLASPACWFSLLAWYGLVPALVYRNDLVLVAQDLFKLALFPAGYLGAQLVFARADRARAAEALRFTTRLALCVVAFQALRFALHHALKRPGGALVYGTILDVLPAAALTAIVLTGRGRGRPLALVAAALSLALAVPGQKRTVLGCVAIACGFLLARTFARRSVLVLGVAYLGALAVGVALLLGGVDAVLESDAFRRVAATEVTTAVGTESWRFFEVRTVAGRLTEGGPLAWLFGYGHGASFEIWHPARGLQSVHSVHHTPAAMVLRYGLAGLIFYGALAVAVLRAVLRRERAWGTAEHTAALAAKAYLVAALVASFVIFGLVDDLLAGLFLAMLRSVGRARSPGVAASPGAPQRAPPS